MTHENTPRYLALGDSYTIGEGTEPHESFPNQLVARLRAQHLQIGDAEIIARTGWTTDELNAAIDAHAPHKPYALVTLLIGVNNQYRGRAAQDYRAEFAALLRRAIAYADGHADRVLVLSIPDWGVTPFARGRENVSPEIDAYNEINRAETLRAGARYVDITPHTRAVRQAAGLLAADELHPSGKQYAQWTELLVPYALAILRATPVQRDSAG